MAMRDSRILKNALVKSAFSLELNGIRGLLKLKFLEVLISVKLEGRGLHGRNYAGQGILLY